MDKLILSLAENNTEKKYVLKEKNYGSQEEFMEDVSSGDEALCYVKADKDGIMGGHYAILTYFEGGEQLDNEPPVNKLVPKGATIQERLYGTLLGGDLKEYKRYASRSGFYELVTGKQGYAERHFVEPEMMQNLLLLPRQL